MRAENFLSGLVLPLLLASCASQVSSSAPLPAADSAPAASVHIRVLVLKPARGRLQLAASAHPEPLEEERFDPGGDSLLVVKDASGHELARRRVGFGSEISDDHRRKMRLIDVSIEAPDSADSVELLEGGKGTWKARIKWKEEAPPSAI